MGQLLRSVKSDLWVTEDLDWLPAGEFPARVYDEFRFKGGNEVSLFRIDMGQDIVERVVAALVCQSQKLVGPFSYRVLDEDTLLASGFELANTPGNTGDDLVNSMHVDVAKLSGKRACDFCYIVAGASGTEIAVEEDDQRRFISRGREFKYLRGIPKSILSLL